MLTAWGLELCCWKNVSRAVLLQQQFLQPSLNVVLGVRFTDSKHTWSRLLEAAPPLPDAGITRWCRIPLNLTSSLC